MDLGGCLVPATAAVLRGATDVFIVAVPTLSGARDAYRSVAAVRRCVRPDARLGLVVNRSTGEIDLGEVAGDLRVPIVAEIPEDAELAAAENARRVVALDGHGGAAASLRQLCGALAAHRVT